MATEKALADLNQAWAEYSKFLALGSVLDKRVGDADLALEETNKQQNNYVLEAGTKMFAALLERAQVKRFRKDRIVPNYDAILHEMQQDVKRKQAAYEGAMDAEHGAEFAKREILLLAQERTQKGSEHLESPMPAAIEGAEVMKELNAKYASKESKSPMPATTKRVDVMKQVKSKSSDQAFVQEYIGSPGVPAPSALAEHRQKVRDLSPPSPRMYSNTVARYQERTNCK